MTFISQELDKLDGRVATEKNRPLANKTEQKSHRNNEVIVWLHMPLVVIALLYDTAAWWMKSDFIDTR